MMACHAANTVKIPYQMDAVYKAWVVSNNRPMISTNPPPQQTLAGFFSQAGSSVMNAFGSKSDKSADPFYTAPRQQSQYDYGTQSTSTPESAVIPRQPVRTGAADPSTFDMLMFSRTDNGKELVDTTKAFSQSAAGQKTGAFLMDNRKEIMQAAQSEQGKAIGRAAWDNRDKVSSAAVSGMKFAASQK
jgi:hypothetical protein